MREHDVFLERALVEEQLITQDQLHLAQRHAIEHKTDLVDALITMEAISGIEIAMIKASVCEAPFVNLADYEPCYTNASLLPRAVAERCCAFPLFVIDGVLTLAIDDPLNLEATDQISRIVSGVANEVDAVLAEREQILAMIARVYALSHTSEDEIEIEQEVDSTPGDGETSRPVIAAVNQMLTDAADQRASDIHLNPDEHEMHLRYRIDGVLQSRQGPPLSMHPALVQRLKVMARLDLTQTRRPQDGKFRFRHAGKQIDVRMSTMPTVCGENVVLRLLAQSHVIQDFHELGMPAPIPARLDEMLQQPYGMILVTGPTGSGKTTTLYTALHKLNSPTQNLMTIEDPVEIRLPYVRQIQVNSEIGLNFASALRSILRQDPDVVLVGEIRDHETAAIALQAALTGHLVLSTLHTNDAVGVIARLRDYRLPPFVINSAMLGVLAQRLVRRVCQHCAVADTPNELMAHRFRLAAGDDSSLSIAGSAGSEHGAEGRAAPSAGRQASTTDQFMRGKGCGRCGQSGYRGRIGIYELLPFTESIQHLVDKDTAIDTIRSTAIQAGMRPMWQDGLDKARLGQTTLEEVAKAASVIEASARKVCEADAPALDHRRSA